MTMIYIDKVPVIFEGTPRLRWERVPRAGVPWTWPMGPDPVETVLGGVWPDNRDLVTIRRLALTRGRLVIVLDGSRESISVHRHRVPRVPDEVRVTENPDTGRLLLEVHHLSWLPVATDRVRGMAFRAEAMRATEQYSGSGSPPIMLEDDLLKSTEPLRFLYRRGNINITDLRTNISCLYGLGASVAKMPDSRSTSQEIPAQRAA